MRTKLRIEEIIEDHLTSIISGEETVASILEKYPQYADELRPRLEAILWLVNARAKLGPRQGFITSSVKSIEHQIESIRPKGFWQRISRQSTPQRWIFNLAASVILLLLLILIGNSLVLSARLSIPGDPLYTSKLVLEDARLALTFDQVEKTNLYIQLSRERTTEIVELVLEGNYELLNSAAGRMETAMIASLRAINNIPQQEQAAERPMTTELRETLSSEVLMLDVLKSSSPLPAHQGIELAIQAAQSGLMALR